MDGVGRSLETRFMGILLEVDVDVAIPRRTSSSRAPSTFGSRRLY